MAKGSSRTLEESLLNNAVDTVVNNLKEYDPVVLLHLVAEVVTRSDLELGLFRILSGVFPPDKQHRMGISPSPNAGGMAGTGNDVMNYLTIPRMHRTQLRGIQQLQEKLMPGGFLMVSKEVTHSDATRMLTQCTSQLEKILRLTKATQANADVQRLKEAIGAGLEEVTKQMGSNVSGQALEYLQAGMRRHLEGSKRKLEEAMDEAVSLGG
jgi:hypothetical protein